MSRLMMAGLVWLSDDRNLGIATAIALSPYTRNPLLRFVGSQPGQLFRAMQKGKTPIARPKPRTVVGIAVTTIVAGALYLQVEHMKRPHDTKPLIWWLGAGLGGGVTTPVNLS